MEFLTRWIEFFLTIDEHLNTFVNHYGFWTYLVLFLIVFIETGFIIFPFLPGNSLLFAAGAIAALPNELNLLWLILTFSAANFIGASINYSIGKKLGLDFLSNSFFRHILKPQQVQDTITFFYKYGGKTILFARLMPFVWTITPFIAGASKMSLNIFAFNNFIGSLIWVSLCCLSGFFLGRVPFIAEHFSIVLLFVIFLSLIPILVSFFKKKNTYCTKNTWHLIL